MAEHLCIQKLKAEMHTQIIGHQILHYPSVGSTNDVARKLAEVEAREGIVVLADEQTAGRGRKGRRWLAPAGTSLLFSLLLRPPLAPQCQRLTMACSLATAEAIESYTGLDIELKWPNDLLAEKRKVGGILTELGIEGELLKYAVVGIGLNVNTDFTLAEMAFLKNRATSLAQELGRPVARESLLASILNRLEECYLALCEGWSPHQEWAARLIMLGQQVIVSKPGGELEGRAEGVDEDGALLIRLKDGRMRRILAGDVSLHPMEDQRA
ncbi:MAG: biotin--[acetyl-CoA-carboxylase] ligase [Chloroflexota bacterium]|nr:biotin--[acetyl-CoA-carboxylase] ligase [Chloroflexota bacterium]